MAEANAYLAHKLRHAEAGTTEKQHKEWREELGWQLVEDNVYIRQRELRPVVPTRAPRRRFGLTHSELAKTTTRSNPVCHVCRHKRTAYFCKTCKTPICFQFSERDCHL